MKRVTLTGLMMFLIGCSNGGGGSSSSPDGGVTNGWTSYSIASSADLPSCEGAIIGRLYYIEDQQVFRVCKSTGWADVVIGNTVVSNRKISNSTTNFCTQYANEVCAFTGGQIVQYADGSVLILGSWQFLYAVGAPDSDTDQDMSSVTVLYPPAAATGFQRLSALVARGNGTKGAYLVYTRDPESIKVVHDTDGDNVPETTDELLFTATLSNW